MTGHNAADSPADVSGGEYYGWEVGDASGRGSLKTYR